MWLKLAAPPDAPTGNDILNRLRTRLPASMRGARADTPLSDLPIDSLDMVELLCLIDDEYGVRFEQSAFNEFKTIGDLADELAAATARQAAKGAKS